MWQFWSKTEPFKVTKPSSVETKLKNGMLDLWGIVQLERNMDLKYIRDALRMGHSVYSLSNIWHRSLILPLLKKKIIIRKKLQRSEFVEIYNKFFPHGNATKFSQFVFDVFGKVLTIKFLLSYFKKFYFYLFWTWMKTLTVAEQSISTSLYKALEW